MDLEGNGLVDVGFSQLLIALSLDSFSFLISGF